MELTGRMNLLGALLLVLLVVVLFGMDWWSNRALRRLGVEPTKSVRWLRIVNLVALVLVLAYAFYVIATR